MAKGKRIARHARVSDPRRLLIMTHGEDRIRERAKANFDETVEIARNSASISAMPTRWCAGGQPAGGKGPSTTRRGIARGAKAEEAKAAGALYFGAEEYVTTVKGGKIDLTAASRRRI